LCDEHLDDCDFFECEGETLVMMLVVLVVMVVMVV